MTRALALPFESLRTQRTWGGTSPASLQSETPFSKLRCSVKLRLTVSVLSTLSLLACNGALRTNSITGSNQGAATTPVQNPPPVSPVPTPGSPPISQVHDYGTGVGYLPAAYAGKPDPWPNNRALTPNSALLEAYVARYGHDPSWPGGEGVNQVGYVAELEGVNLLALNNAAFYGGTGPGGEPLHAGYATITETIDLSYQLRRGSSFYGTWAAAFADGGNPNYPMHLNDPTRVCGPYSLRRTIYGAYTFYGFNIPPCR